MFHQFACPHSHHWYTQGKLALFGKSHHWYTQGKLALFGKSWQREVKIRLLWVDWLYGIWPGSIHLRDVNQHRALISSSPFLSKRTLEDLSHFVCGVSFCCIKSACVVRQFWWIQTAEQRDRMFGLMIWTFSCHVLYLGAIGTFADKKPLHNVDLGMGVVLYITREKMLFLSQSCRCINKAQKQDTEIVSIRAWIVVLEQKIEQNCRSPVCFCLHHVWGHLHIPCKGEH